MKATKQVATLLIVILLASCSALKRHDRIVKNNPHVHTVDSIVLTDTLRVVIPEASVDTIVSIKELRDTIIIKDKQLSGIVYLKGDDVYIKAKCKTDTIEKIIEIKVPVTYYKESVFTFKWWHLLVAVVLFLLFKLYKE